MIRLFESTGTRVLLPSYDLVTKIEVLIAYDPFFFFSRVLERLREMGDSV